MGEWSYIAFKIEDMAFIYSIDFEDYTQASIVS